MLAFLVLLVLLILLFFCAPNQNNAMVFIASSALGFGLSGTIGSDPSHESQVATPAEFKKASTSKLVLFVLFALVV